MIARARSGAAGTPLDTVATTAPALANTAAAGQARYVDIAGARNTASAGVAAGGTVIPLTAAPNGVQVGQQVRFAGHATVYTVAAVGAGNVTLGAGLTAGVAASEDGELHRHRR